jgi:hypothetical protein
MNCERCHLDVIEEELYYHVCFTGKIKNIRFDSDAPYSLSIFDGKNWLKCPNLRHQPTGNTSNKPTRKQNHKTGAV